MKPDNKSAQKTRAKNGAKPVRSSAWIEALEEAMRAVSAASKAAQREDETSAMYEINRAWWHLASIGALSDGGRAQNE